MMKIEIHDREKSAEAEAILNKLREYNALHVPPAHYRELTVSCKNETGEVVAGLTGHTSWGWLFVRLLWVSDELRGQGYGKRLMAEAESEAQARGCHGVWLDTFSFQAREFYQKLGYQIFGTLEQFPKGKQRFYLYKKLEFPADQ